MTKKRLPSPTDDNAAVRSRSQVIIAARAATDHIRVREIGQRASVRTGDSGADAAAGDDLSSILWSDAGGIAVGGEDNLARFDCTAWG